MSKGITRRALILGGSLAAASAMLAPALSGCSTGTAEEGQQDEGVVKSYPTHVHEVDVLVVGGGLSGCSAALRALQLGNTVAILDKGQFGHSGTSGYNWGHMYTTYDLATDIEGATQSAVITKIRGGSGVSDQDVCAAIAGTVMEMKQTLTLESLGMFHERLEDGTPGACFWGAPMKSEQSTLISGIYPRFLNQRVKKMGAEVYDQTMLIDVLVSEENVAAGGIAVDLRSGEMHVFKAKSTILAMGSYNWICGWTGWRPQSMCGPECTGDAYSILMKRGVPVGNFEFVSTDNNMWNPGCLRLTFGLGLEYPDADRAVNSEGERFVVDYIAENPNQGGIETLEQLIAGEVYHGRGSEHGGVWLDLEGFGGQEMELFYRRTPDNLRRNFGYELPSKVEVVPEHWASYCQPKVDVSMQTSIPGLFFAGYPTVSGGVEGCLASGQIAGESAAVRAAQGAGAAIDWNQVNEVVAFAYELLEREPEDGIPAFKVMRSVQEAYAKGLNLLRDEAGIQEALDELKRIKAEDLPRMYVPSKSRVFNHEWRHAFEAEHMVNSAIGVALGALERRESRYMHVRTDYPQLNNSEYLKRFMVSLADGEFSVAAEDVDMSIMDAATMEMLIPSTNINSREK